MKSKGNLNQIVINQKNLNKSIKQDISHIDNA
jgi:hypothetical protein